ncbi:MAG: dihydroneopterin aldolase [Candidatus Eisenbacteria bacterium]|uniref:dihydroneopterin aldolase n=1 Tax=Eiseniibacteriota bacterium TaxID=2212470 RepID=A0A948WF70_UNCEI|nr:dihydroneopterin aldolase [Candidatus Eisenbacteria bacterium]MBU1947948.1 dihydroneopterin aldolase [Candidatus Eisenbacteria bacterium]MBU2693428.1 dihydroneopterin aldolase [Candidatus Eisenbacteria bacterium]
MEDRILIRNLLVRGILGVNDWERETRQDILLNLTLFTDTRATAASDDLKGAVNYRTLAKQLIEHVETSSRYTVEALANDLARICFRWSNIYRVRVRVEKRGALRYAESVGVEIERGTEDFA